MQDNVEENVEDEKVLFKNTSKMDENEISIFQSYALKKTILLSSIGFVALFAAAGAGFCFLSLSLGIILIVCGGIGGLILIPYLIKESVKKQNMENLGDKKYLNTFEFYSDHVLVSTEATSSKESNDYKQIASQQLSYADIFQVVIYKNRLFIFISPKQSFIVHFNGMTKGTIGEIIDLIKSKNVKIIDKTDVKVEK